VLEARGRRAPAFLMGARAHGRMSGLRAPRVWFALEIALENRRQRDLLRSLISTLTPMFDDQLRIS
jgi:hypothetical protein